MSVFGDVLYIFSMLMLIIGLDIDIRIAHCVSVGDEAWTSGLVRWMTLDLPG